MQKGREDKENNIEKKRGWRNRRRKEERKENAKSKG